MKPENEVSQMKMLTVRIPVEVHRALKVRAVETDTTVAVIVESLIRQFLNGRVRV